MPQPRSPFRLLSIIAALVAPTGCGRDAVPGASAPALRVCADPNHLPYSNDRAEGFENRIAELIARDLGRELEYVWRPQRRGFLRTGVNSGACDLVIGVARGVELAATTAPYYRSSYVFVRPRGSAAISSLDDPALATLQIGVQIVGDDYHNSPPTHALARRGLARNLVGYTVYGDYGKDNPLGDVVHALERGEIDVALVWGPVAGYFAQRAAIPLELEAVSPADDAGLPMRFEISLAVRRGTGELRARLDALLARRRGEIDAILDEYAVPRV